MCVCVCVCVYDGGIEKKIHIITMVIDSGGIVGGKKTFVLQHF